MLIDLENKRANLGFAILGTGAGAMLASLFLAPTWALYVGCMAAGLQAFLVASAVSTYASIRRLRAEAGRTHALLPPHPRAKWTNTEDFLLHKQGTVVLLEAVIDE